MKPTNFHTISQDGHEKLSLPPSQREAFTKAFADEGYFLIPDVVSKQKLSALHQRLAAEFDKATRSGTLFAGGGLLSGHLNCFPGEGSRFVYETLRERGILDLIQALHPQATRLPNVGCNFNLPHSAIQHYHADREFTREFLIVNIAVVDTTVENGAMELIPGTHRKFYPYWRFALERPYRNSLRVPMQQGDILVRTSNVWHRGMPNQTSVARPMLALTWEDGGSMHEDPFGAGDGKITFRPNWFKPTRLGRMRERLFVKVPLAYSALRFLSSLSGNKGY
jgi:hypothetical protein